MATTYATPTVTLDDLFRLAKVTPPQSTDELIARLGNQRSEYARLGYEASCMWERYDAAIDDSLPRDEIEQFALAAEILEARAWLHCRQMDDLKAQIIERGN